MRFNSQPPEGGCWHSGQSKSARLRFQLTAARRRLRVRIPDSTGPMCFNSQPPEGGCEWQTRGVPHLHGFNSQPPEGGCINLAFLSLKGLSFNSQPPEGGCSSCHARSFRITSFQLTAARRRLREYDSKRETALYCFNSQPPEGGCHGQTHSRQSICSFNSQPPEGGCIGISAWPRRHSWFQLTAARRRLPDLGIGFSRSLRVSTHSRPKAAASNAHSVVARNNRFNSQPPEGGCARHSAVARGWYVSTHSRPKAAAGNFPEGFGFFPVSTHSRPKAAA